MNVTSSKKRPIRRACTLAMLSLAALGTPAWAGFQVSDQGCNLLAGSPDSCIIVGPASGTTNFTGALGAGGAWTLSHPVKRYVLGKGGCGIPDGHGGIKTEVITIQDQSASGPGPIAISNMHVIPGVTYAVTLTGPGELFAGTFDPATAQHNGGTHPAWPVPDDKTKGTKPPTVCKSKR